MNKKETLIWLHSLTKITNKSIEKLINTLGDISLIWNISNKEIIQLESLSEEVKSEIIRCRNKVNLEELMNKIESEKVNIITIYDEQYPEKLRNIFDYPKVLYIKGDFIHKDELLISIVGSRKATPYGRWAAEKFSGELSKLGVTIVSGMASGIDTVAHKGALKNEGRTVAVLGSGVDVVYPKSNRKLYDDIKDNGCIISEFPLGTEPMPYNFPQRNRIISGMSLGTIVIEATEKSGSLITAYHAMEQGREVFAVPGNINSIYSKGTNMLIRDGAKIILDIEDILEEIQVIKNDINSSRQNVIDYNLLGEDEIKIVKYISERPLHTDMISYLSGIKIQDVNSILTILEMKGIVKQMPGKIFTIA